MPFNPLTGRWDRIQPGWVGGSTWDQPTYGDDPDWAAETMQPGPLAQPGKEYWSTLTPQEDWQRMMVDLPADPRWRRGFESMYPRLSGRYLLERPSMGAGDSPTSFAQFLGDVGTDPYYRSGNIPADMPTLRDRAERAARMAMMPEYATTGLIDPVSQAYYGTFGGGSEQAITNQMAVAQLMARQRAGGGVFRGGLGDAIGRAVYSMARARQASGAPETSFLDWYLKQTG